MYNHQLDTFIQVADAGSFSKAAKALYISSTAVMKQINLLEESLDVQLLVRTPRGLTLTDAGREHPQINIIDFDQFTLEAFNRCENGNNVIMSIDAWDNVHPMLKTLPVEWDSTIPYGLLHSPEPSPTVGSFLDAVARLYREN